MWKTLVVTVCVAAGLRRAEAQDGSGWDIRLSVPGEPGKDYPTLGVIPRTSFSCGGKEAGYYADVETGCQAFRVCTTGATYGYQSFLCPNGTVFNQEVFVCDWWMNVNCYGSTQYFKMDNKFENLRVGPQMMNEVEKMITYTMRNPYQNRNNLPNKMVVTQVYNPPSGQLNPNQGTQVLDDNRNPRARFFQNNNAQSNNRVPVPRNQYLNPNNHQASQSSHSRLNENTQAASTPSPRYVPAVSSNTQSPNAQFNLQPTSTPQPDLEVTYRKQQYTYPSQADKQYTYKIPSSPVENLNQQVGLNLGQLNMLTRTRTQQKYVDAQQNLAYVQDFFNNAVEQAQNYQNSVNQNFQNFVSNGGALNTNTLHNANLQLSQNLEQLAKSQVANLQLANDRTAHREIEQSHTSSQQTDTQRTGTLGATFQNTGSQYVNNANSQINNEQQFTNSINNNLPRNSIDSSGAFYSGYLNQGQNLQKSGNLVAQNEQKLQHTKNQNEQANYDLNQFNENTQIGGQQVDTTSNYQPESNLNSNLNIDSNLQSHGVQAEQLLQHNDNSVNNKHLTATQQNLPSTREENGNFYSSRFSNGGHQNLNNLNAGIGQAGVSQQNLVSSSGTYNLNNNAQNELAATQYKSANNINNQDFNARAEGVNFAGFQQNIQTTRGYDESLGNLNHQPGSSQVSDTNKSAKNINYQQNFQSIKDENGNVRSSQFFNGGQQNLNNLNADVGQVDVSQQNLVSSSGTYNFNNNVQNRLAGTQYKSAKNINYQDYNDRAEGVNFQGLQQNIQTTNDYVQTLGNVNHQSGSSQVSDTNKSSKNINYQQNLQSTKDENGNFYSSQFFNGGQQNFNNLNAGVGQVDVSQQNLVSSSGTYNFNNNTQNVLAGAQYKSANNQNNQDNNAQVEGVTFQGLQQNTQTINHYDEALKNSNYESGSQDSNQNYQVPNVNANVTKILSSEAHSLSDIIGTNVRKYMQSGALANLQQYNQNGGLAPTSSYNHQGVKKDNLKTISQVSNLNMNINSNRNFVATTFNSNRNNVTAQDHHQLHSSVTQPVNNQNVVTYKADQAVYVYSKYSGTGQPNNNVNVATKQNYETNQAEQNSQYNAQIRQAIRNNLNTGEIQTSVQFLPSVSFELDDDEEQKKFFAAVKSGILGDRLDAYKVNVGEGGSSFTAFSSSQRIPSNSQGYSIQNTVPTQQTFQHVQSNVPTRLYAGPSSYVAPQQSIGRLDTAVQEFTLGMVAPTRSMDRLYKSERLEDLDEEVVGTEAGYPRIKPSIPFTF